MSAVLDTLFPVIALIALGLFAAARLGFNAGAANGLSQFVYNFATPVMLLRSFSLADLPPEVPWGLIGSYVIAQYVLYAIVLLVIDHVSGRRAQDNVVMAASSTFSNLILVGYPIITHVLGQDATVPLFIIASFHAALGFTVATVLIEPRRAGNTGYRELPGKIWLQVSRNPIIISMLLGSTLNMLDWRLPHLLDQFALLIQGALTPCALFAVGASLHHFPIRGSLTAPLAIVGVKNVLFPVMVWVLATGVFQLDVQTAQVLILMAAMPAGVTIFVIAERYQAAREFSTTLVSLSSLCALCTLVAVVWFVTGHFVALSSLLG